MIEEPWEEEKNKAVMEEFDSFLRTVKYSSTTNPDSSTFTKSLGHMFKYPDSFLNFHRKHDAGFNFGRLMAFKSPGYVQLSEPITWMNSIAGSSGQEQPGRR